MNEMKVGNVFLPGLEVLFLVRSGLTSASQPNQSHLLFTQILGTVLEFIYWYFNVSTCSSCINIALKVRQLGSLDLKISGVGDMTL